ncbi:conserved hypothetical protein [Uncinocarpus reesii 1704]|uniref:Methyltransferase n=1 Tax=Uncinocarpus reesii (strain UAMH 1704) TaxID=336963 RepID=C4JPE3_UNCRE|nr:uncharacterized protein UREG_04525 [Uncinocarpus reesii 1704]EEP79679.1 conserved hypothetical protein [Uncinocarpus reesii 1704]
MAAGIWAMLANWWASYKQAFDLVSREFADDHPHAAVIGTDLSPIQPLSVPPNLSFEIDDCCDEWLYTPESFDFVHVRGLYGCVADWDEFYNQAFKCVKLRPPRALQKHVSIQTTYFLFPRHLKRGGYIEQLEQSVAPKSDDHSTDGTIMDEWGRVSLAVGDKFGKTLRIVDEAKAKMVAAGFEDVTEHRFKCPIGDWPVDARLKELGKVARLYWEEGVEDWSTMLLTRVMNFVPYILWPGGTDMFQAPSFMGGNPGEIELAFASSLWSNHRGTSQEVGVIFEI